MNDPEEHRRRFIVPIHSIPLSQYREGGIFLQVDPSTENPFAR